DSSGVPLSDPIAAGSGPAIWTSIEADANGGFTLMWDGASASSPMAQDYTAGGAPLGAAYALTTAPATAPFISASVELPPPNPNPQQDPWTTLLPNGDSVVVTPQDSSGPGAPQLLMQQFDPAGHEVGPDYVGVFQGLPGLGNVQTTALTAGNYVVTFTDNSNYGGQLYYELFRADGTHVAQQTVASTGFQQMHNPATAALPDGGFVMSWVAAAYNSQDLNNPAPYGVFLQEFRADGSAVAAAKMLDYLPPNSTTPETIVAANGSYTVSWIPGGKGTPEVFHFTEQGTAAANYGNDVIFTPAAAYTLPVGPHSVTLVGSTAQTVTGNNLGDTITSNDTASTLIGGTGNDT